MEKFEKILSFFIKNQYNNIILSTDNKYRLKSYILSFFIILALLNILSLTIGQILINLLIEENRLYKQLNIIYYIYYFLQFFTFSTLIYLLYNYFYIKSKTIYTIYYSFLFSLIINILLPLVPLNGLFLINDIQLSTIYTFFSVYLLLIIYYNWQYYNKWKKNILQNDFRKIKEKLKKNNYSVELNSFFSKFDLNEDIKDKPKLTKIAQIIVSFIIRFGFTIPILAVLSSNGVGGNGMIYFAIYLILFVIPEMSKSTSKQLSLYCALKQIEKEENITIYNGKFKL